MSLRAIKYKILSKILWGKKGKHYKENINKVRNISNKKIIRQLEDIKQLTEIINRSFQSNGQNNIKDKIENTLTAYTAHQQIFPAFKNKYQGRELVLVATGPTLNYYKERKDAVHIGLNSAILTDIHLEYIFMQDYSVLKDFIIDKLGDKKFKDSIKFLGRLQSEYPLEHCHIPEKYMVQHEVLTYYDNVTFTPEHQIFPLNIATTAFTDPGSVVFPAAQFALWTNPKTLYLVGCDCSQGHFNNNEGSAKDLVEPWKKFKKFASIYYPDVEIIVINPVGLKGVFKGIYTEDFLKENPNTTSEL